jgi:hypothetical protein
VRISIQSGALGTSNATNRFKTGAFGHDPIAKVIENYVRQLRTDKVFVYFT